MIFAEIDQDADRRIERRRKIDLVGRALDHVGRAAIRGGSSDRIAVPMLPPICTSWPARCNRWRDQRRRRRLAVGAGDGDERRVGRVAPALAAKQLDVADDFDRRRCAPVRPPNAAPDASAVRRAPAPARRSSTSRPCADRRSECRARRRAATLPALSSKATTSAPPASSALALASPEPPRPNTATLLSGECRDRDHQSPQLQRRQVRRAPARSRRSRSGSRSAARSSPFARSGDGSAPSGTRACRSA